MVRIFLKEDLAMWKILQITVVKKKLKKGCEEGRVHRVAQR